MSTKTAGAVISIDELEASAWASSEEARQLNGSATGRKRKPVAPKWCKVSGCVRGVEKYSNTGMCPHHSTKKCARCFEHFRTVRKNSNLHRYCSTCRQDVKRRSKGATIG